VTRRSDSGLSSTEGFLKPYAIAALALLVVGLLGVLIELQSPSLIYWTGERVQGTNDGGIIYYTVDEDQRTLTAPGEPPSRPQPVTVYADPDDSARDRAEKPAKWFDAVFVLVWPVAAAAVILTGLVRRRRFRQVVAAQGRSR
jgi:hypothetical protein